MFFYVAIINLRFTEVLKLILKLKHTQLKFTKFKSNNPQKTLKFCCFLYAFSDKSY